MSIEQGLSRVAPIVDSFSVAGVLDPRIYGAFDVNVMEYADQRGQNFAAPAPCRTQYDSHKPELQMWFFGIMLCEYVAGLLAKKVEEGHCNEHRKEPRSATCPDFPSPDSNRSKDKRFGPTRRSSTKRRRDRKVCGQRQDTADQGRCCSEGMHDTNTGSRWGTARIIRRRRCSAEPALRRAAGKNLPLGGSPEPAARGAKQCRVARWLAFPNTPWQVGRLPPQH